MQHRTQVGVSALALMATLLLPSVSLAKENEVRHERLGSSISIDASGDNNGLAKFKKHSEDKKLKNIEGVVTVNTQPAAPSTEGTLVVRKGNGKLFTFTYDSTGLTKYTTFLRKFKGTATSNEIMVGDAVKVFVTKLEKGKAVVVWDKGIWLTEVKGVISNLNVDGKAFTLTVTKEGIEFSTTVKFDALTTFMMKDGTVKLATDLANGQEVKIKGAWDVVGKFLLAKKIVIIPATI